MDFIFEVQKILIRENKKTKKHFYSIIKMSKEYHCVQVNDEKICNETNPDKFIKGRYTTCINCKNKYLKEYRQKVKNSKELESNMNLIEKINENKGDLGENVYEMMVDMFHTKPIKGLDIAIPGKIQEIEDNICEFIKKSSLILVGMEKNINSLVEENKNLKNKEKDLKKDYDKIKREYEELFDKYNELLFKNLK
jgi:hypothetical protein